jgi:hypothetical protein
MIGRIIKENFSQIHQISKMRKCPNCHFLMINKFQWVTKHIEFFFGNFHIWYIATCGWSRLWLYHKIGKKWLEKSIMSQQAQQPNPSITCLNQIWLNLCLDDCPFRSIKIGGKKKPKKTIATL